jgi:hypothetical protein
MANEPFAVRVAGTGRLVGELTSRGTAHRIAHLFLGAWPELSPLTLTDRTRDESWTVEAGACTPLGCDVALRDEHAGSPARRVDLETLRRVVEGLRRL